jgi:hypothetical protein
MRRLTLLPAGEVFQASERPWAMQRAGCSSWMLSSAAPWQLPRLTCRRFGCRHVAPRCERCLATCRHALLQSRRSSLPPQPAACAASDQRTSMSRHGAVASLPVKCPELTHSPVSHARPAALTQHGAQVSQMEAHRLPTLNGVLLWQAT